MSSWETYVGVVTRDGRGLLVTCVTCGWCSAPAPTGAASGALWDDHVGQDHRRADEKSALGRT